MKPSDGVPMGNMIGAWIGGGVGVRGGFITAGDRIVKHIHDYEHLSLLGMGTVCVLVDGEMSVYHAPCAITIQAGKQHEVLAVTNAIWFCVHAETDAGNIDEIEIKEGGK